MSVASCPICNQPFPLSEIERHAATCLDPQQRHRESRLTGLEAFDDDDEPYHSHSKPLSTQNNHYNVNMNPNESIICDEDGDYEVFPSFISPGSNSRMSSHPSSNNVTSSSSRQNNPDPAYSLKRRLSEMPKPPTVLEVLSQSLDDDVIDVINDESSCSNPQTWSTQHSKRAVSDVGSDVQFDWDQMISVVKSGIPHVVDEQKVKACSLWDEQIRSFKQSAGEAKRCFDELKVMMQYASPAELKKLVSDVDKQFDCLQSRIYTLQQPSMFVEAFDKISRHAAAHDQQQEAAAQARATLLSRLLDDTEKQHQRRYQEDLSMVTIKAMDEQEKAVSKLGEEYTAQRLTVENELNEMRARQQTMEEEMSKLSSGQFELEEEREAMRTGEIKRVELRAQQGFGEVAQEHHYRICESQFHRMLSQSGQSQFKVTSVEVIINPGLRKRYQSFQERLRAQGSHITEYLTFHGTSSAAVDSIVISGFKIGGVDVPVASGSVHGMGIYSSESPAFAMRYIKDGRRSLLFARTCPGPDSTIVKSADGSNIEQLVVFSPDQMLPQYIVHFEPIGMNNSLDPMSALRASLASMNAVTGAMTSAMRQPRSKKRRR